MLVLNDPAAQLSSVDGKSAAPAAPVTNLSAFASSNDIVVKVRASARVASPVSNDAGGLLIVKVECFFRSGSG